MLARILAGAEPYSMLPLRLAAGVVFAVHGWEKLFVIGIAAWSASLRRRGIEPALFWGAVVTLVELLGGIGLILGLLTRWAAFFLAIDMVMATYLSHLHRGFFIRAGGYEFTLTLLGACLTLLLAGAKKPSVDRALPKEF